MVLVLLSIEGVDIKVKTLLFHASLLSVYCEIQLHSFPYLSCR